MAEGYSLFGKVIQLSLLLGNRYPRWGDMAAGYPSGGCPIIQGGDILSEQNVLFALMHPIRIIAIR